MNEEELEKLNLEDLDEVLKAAQELGIKLVLIGGYAVASYTRGYRSTKDIDLVADKPAVGKLRGLLKRLGYSVRDTEFGIAGSRPMNGQFIDLHISVGKILDASTGREYPVDSSFFRNARRMEVRAYHSKDTSLKAAVIDLETLVVLKSMTVGRQKDQIDLLSLLRDKRDEIDLTLVAQRARSAGLDEHLLDRIRDYATRLRDGELDRVWFSVTGARTSYVEKRDMRAFFARLTELLRQK
jgi:predicted nucleotidyltransferase